ALMRRLDDLLLRERLGMHTGASKKRIWHGMLLLDLDRFDKFNMARGSAWGDALLSAVGLKLVSVVGDSAWVARYSGDQFAVVLENIGFGRTAARQQVHAVAQLVQSAITHVTLANSPETVATSFGIG